MQPTRLALFSAKPFDREAFTAQACAQVEMVFHEPRLDPTTAPLAAGCTAVCAFANDQLDRATLTALAQAGVRLVALRCAGFDHVDRVAARELGLAVARVPAYSPYAVAEHAATLLMALNRKVHLAWNRVRGWDFSLDGLMGFDLHGRTVGVVGTGRIGIAFARIMLGFGCTVIASDPLPSDEARGLGVVYVPLTDLLARSDVISLHCPLTPASHHLIGQDALSRIKRGAYLINTGRGGLLDSDAAIAAVKDGRLGALGIDVFEREQQVFFEDWSQRILQDDALARLITFPNVLVTAHQAFFTRDALANIVAATLDNVSEHARTGAPRHPVPQS